VLTKLPVEDGELLCLENEALGVSTKRLVIDAM
jgi:hypothetical protein